MTYAPVEAAAVPDGAATPPAPPAGTLTEEPEPGDGGTLPEEPELPVDGEPEEPELPLDGEPEAEPVEPVAAGVGVAVTVK